MELILETVDVRTKYFCLKNKKVKQYKLFKYIALSKTNKQTNKTKHIYSIKLRKVS